MSSAQDKVEYIEEAGVALEGVGLPRMLGRIVGALLLAHPPEMSADQLAAALHASLGTISTSTRALQDMGVLERVRKPGDRKKYFRLRPGGWHEIVRKRAESFENAITVAEKGLRILGSENPEQGRGLREMLDFMRFVVKEQATALATWQRKFAKQHAA